MKIRIATIILISGIALLSCSKSSNNGYTNPNPTPTGGSSVSIFNMKFATASLTVKAGTTVTWTNNDNMTHTVTADDNSFTSADMAYGDTYSHTFSTTGTFNYHCKYHSTMTANVVVN